MPLILTVTLLLSRIALLSSPRTLALRVKVFLLVLMSLALIVVLNLLTFTAAVF